MARLHTMMEGNVLTARGSMDVTVPARPGLVPRLLRAILRWLLRRLFVFEFTGLERLPSGPYIAAANHPSWLETFTLIGFLPAAGGLRMLASRAATLDIAWRRIVLNLAEVVLPVDTDGREARASIRIAVDYLRRGSVIGIFPEDLSQPTSPAGTVRPLRRGVAFLARASGSPVVPIGVADTRELWRGRRIRINLGEPLDPPRDRSEDAPFLAKLAERIESLRPPAEPLPAHRPWRWLSNLF
jgi:1-acyl-sn-glycerol-3-phosphate acyltransferase